MKNFMRELAMEWMKKHKEEGEADDEVLFIDQVPYSPVQRGEQR